MSTPQRVTRHTPLDRVNELIHQLQTPNGGGNGSAMKSSPQRLTPAQFRSNRPQYSPGSSMDDGSDGGGSDDFTYRRGDNNSSSLDNSFLDRSGELEDDELDRLIAQAAALTGLGAPTQQTARQPTQKNGGATGSAVVASNLAANALSNAALQSKIASERAVLGELITKLTSLQNQASELKQLSEVSKRAQAEMRALQDSGDEDLRELEREKQELQRQLDEMQAGGGGSGVEDDNEGSYEGSEGSEQEGEDDGQSPQDSPQESPLHSSDDEEQPQPRRRKNVGYATPYSPQLSDSEIEVEVELSRDQSEQPDDQQPAPAESDEEIESDTRQLKQLEDLMKHLASTAEYQKHATRQHYLSDEQREAAEHEAEVDERLFYGRQALAQAQAKERERLGPHEIQVNSQQSPVHQQNQNRNKNGGPSASQSSPTSLAVPASRVPPVPISRWIGPSTLPSANPGGGSGRHAVYQDRPATAVGTTRGAVRGGGGGAGSQTSRSGTSNGGTTEQAWQAPTISSLPPSNSLTGTGTGLGSRTNKSASVSSRASSMLVNAPDDSERSIDSPPSGGYGDRPQRRGGFGGIAEDSQEEGDEDDGYDTEGTRESDYVVVSKEEAQRARVYAMQQQQQQQQQQEAHARAQRARQQQHQSQFEESPLPSDSDSELPYAINASAALAQSSRPKTARQAAPSHLNGRATGRQRGQQHASSSAQPSKQPRKVPPSRVQRAFEPSSLSPSDLQSVLAYIGTSLFLSTINVGHTGASGAVLGSGRLGATQSQRALASSSSLARPETAPVKRVTPTKGYGFQPAVPQRAWQ